MVGIENSRRPPSQQHSRRMSDVQDYEARNALHYPAPGAKGRKSIGERPIGDNPWPRRTASGSRQSRRSRSLRRQERSDMPAVPPSGLDSQNGESALMATGKRMIGLVGWKRSKPPGKQSQDVEQHAPSTPPSYRERVKAKASFQSVSPKIKLLEAGTPEQLSTPHANSPELLQEPTQEKEEEDKDRAEDIGAADGNGQKDPDRQTGMEEAVLHQGELINIIEAELERTKAELKAALQQIEQDQKEHRDEVQVLNRDIRALRAKVSEKSSKSIEVPLQLPLRCPESEIINAWHELKYDVRNLAVSHFKGTRESKMVTWAQKQKAYLRDVTPHYMDVIRDKKCAAAFIEAVIWNALCLCAFGPFATNGPFCWAGKYKRKLATMSKSLIRPSWLMTDRIRQSTASTCREIGIETANGLVPPVESVNSQSHLTFHL